MDYNQKIIGQGLTYDDVLLVPDYSDILPHQVNVTTHFSSEYQTKHSYCVCCYGYRYRSKMAISIAQDGGIGVLHKNMSIAEQSAGSPQGKSVLKVV